jgi:hypothetical protein
MTRIHTGTNMRQGKNRTPGYPQAAGGFRFQWIRGRPADQTVQETQSPKLDD